MPARKLSKVPPFENCNGGNKMDTANTVIAAKRLKPSAIGPTVLRKKKISTAESASTKIIDPNFRLKCAL
jgi:hypothetical protein